MPQLPAVSLVAVPGRRARALELAREVERRGFPSMWAPSLGGEQLSFCTSALGATTDLVVGTAIHPIYFRHAWDVAATAGYLHETSGGRFRLGLGVSHGPVHERLGLQTGKPLADTRTYVEGLRAAAGQSGELPPVILATLRDRMLELAVEVAEGAVWANGARSHMAAQLAGAAAGRPQGFTVANMVPTVIDDDREAAAAVCRKTLGGYVRLPNYRNYWKAAGYEEEMTAIEAALEAGDTDRIPALMHDRWLADVTLFGPAGAVRDGIEAWFAAGVDTPIVVPSSTTGGQLKALQELFDLYAR
ncbi:MAG TPA: LLM class flavin-dependent oxidoreductase [Acidimicrobiales bacterium]|nr:LLM class flavin-dependent oxidoreductase [Acidimicrobiales bacterium]